MCERSEILVENRGAGFEWRTTFWRKLTCSNVLVKLGIVSITCKGLWFFLRVTVSSLLTLLNKCRCLS